MDLVRKAEMPWTNLDYLHRALLEDQLKEFHMAPSMLDFCSPFC
jgi:hypothetical protein